MIRALVLACFLITVAKDVVAQSLRVRSGEHGDYTRLVVQIPKGVRWSLHQRVKGARLNIALRDAVFETSAVFDRLSDNRLTAVYQAEPGSALDLTFGCDCVATAFLHRESMVVIDIAPGEFKPTRQIDLGAPIWLPQRRPDRQPPATSPAHILPLPLLELNRNRLESLLMSRVLQGADRDVVDLQLSAPGPRQSTTLGPVKVPADLARNLHVSSILDEVRAAGVTTDPQIFRQPKCIADAELSFETWAGEHRFPHQLAQLRRGLFQEFDRIDPGRTIALAKLYTYYGFGAEAGQALRLLPAQTTETRRISAIAEAMDNLPVAYPNPFSGQQRCDGIAALWAMLIEKTLQPDADLNAIEQAFARLPQHLRRHFGPALAATLVDSDELEASRRILRAVQRIEERDGPSLTLVQAQISDAEGDAVQTEKLLTDLAYSADADEEAALALARLVEQRWSRREGVSQREVDFAAAYSVEMRRSQRGPMMARTHALALALNQRFDQAMEVIHAAPIDKDWLRTRDQVVRVLAERADDITFLFHATKIAPTLQEKLDLDTAISMSKRLGELGFNARAYALANRPLDKANKQSRAHLRASAALMQGRPRQALLELSDDKSIPAQQLRVSALIKAGDYAQAAEILSSLGEVEKAQRYFWLAERNDLPEDLPIGKFANLRRISHSLSQPIARSPEKPLADARMLLEDSSHARDLIADLMDNAGREMSP